ncbi:MAG: hypothetical protein EOM08_11375 [Clostridia bacterium]|nr:hypothetical protein [Clostridia bacterium]
MNEITQTKIFLLKELQMSKYSDLEYASKNWLMTVPKEGLDVDWRKAKDAVQFLDDWIKELETGADQQTPLSGYDFPEGGFHENK